MIYKRYLLISLLAASALLTGCSDSDENAANDSKSSAVADNGLENPSLTTAPAKDIPAETFEAGAVEVVTIPASIEERPDYVPVPLGEVSGSVVETEEEVTAVFNTFKPDETRAWVQELTTVGWTEHKYETLDNEATYSVFLTNEAHQAIAIYANNATDAKNTLITFSK